MYLVVRTVGVDEDTSAVVVLCTASFKTTDPNPYVGLVGSAMAPRNILRSTQTRTQLGTDYRGSF